MARQSPSSHEGLKAARLMMVLSSLSPLFILWMIRGKRTYSRMLLQSRLRIDGSCTLWFPVGTDTHSAERQR